jgi:hypothetical protein
MRGTLCQRRAPDLAECSEFGGATSRSSAGWAKKVNFAVIGAGKTLEQVSESSGAEVGRPGR